jgi:hypothetical protein
MIRFKDSDPAKPKDAPKKGGEPVKPADEATPVALAEDSKTQGRTTPKRKKSAAS